MDRKMDNKTKSLSLPLVLLAGCILVVMIFLLKLYGLSWIVIGLTSAIYLTIITLIFLWIRLPHRQSKKTSLHDIEQLKILKSLFTQLKEKTRKPDPYRLPWYFSICDEQDKIAPQMRAMGFEALNNAPVLGLTFWLMPNAVMVVIHQDAEKLNKGLQAFSRFILKYRARQPMNGIILNIPLPFILSDSSSLISDKIACQRALIKQLNQLIGTNLPIYCSITELCALKDFCESFALGLPVETTQGNKEQLLGCLTSPSEGDLYNETWFEHSFNQLFNQLYQHHQHRMRSEIQTSSIKVIAGAPFQFYKIKTVLKRYLNVLFEPIQNNKHFFFRGYFFSSTGQNGQQLDQLSFHVANRLGYNSIPVKPSTSDQPSLFSKWLFPAIFEQESAIVGSRAKANSRYFFGKIFGYGVIVCSFTLTALFIQSNYHFYSDQDKKALSMLEKVNISSFGMPLPNMSEANMSLIDADRLQENDFSDRTDTLWQLKSITQLYIQPLPEYIVTWLPRQLVKHKLNNVYSDLSKEYLLNFLKMRLENKISLMLKDNKISGETFMQFHLNYSKLFTETHKNIDELVTFYAEVLPKTNGTEEQVKIMLNDLLVQGKVAKKINHNLLTKIKRQVIGKDFPRYIYNTFMAQPTFKAMIDKEPELGKTLFTFTQPNKDTFKLPFAYTKDGFTELKKTIQNKKLDDLIQTYQYLLSAQEQASIKGRVYAYFQTRYVNEYISAWKNFEKQTYPKQHFTEKTINLLLDKLTRPVSDLDNYYDAIGYNTSLFEEIKTGETLLKTNLLTRHTEADFNDKNHLAMAKKITTAFEKLHRWQTDNTLKKHYMAVSTWLARVNNTDALMSALINKKSKNEGFPLFTEQTNTPDYARKLSMQIQRSVNKIKMEQVQTHIVQHWKTDVLNYFQQHLIERFPFKYLSEEEVTLVDFSTFFSNKGRLKNFQKNYLANAKTNLDGELFLPDFIGSQQWVFSKDLSYFLEQSNKIQQTFFNKDEPGFDVFLSVKQMSPALLSLTVTQDVPILNYQHGPKIRHPLHWPIQDSADAVLLFATQNNNGTKKTQIGGVWSWFRLVYQHYFNRSKDALALTKEQTKGQTNRNNHQLTLSLFEQQVELAIDTPATLETNPFEPSLFIGYKIPALFDNKAPDLVKN